MAMSTMCYNYNWKLIKQWDKIVSENGSFLARTVLELFKPKGFVGKEIKTAKSVIIDISATWGSWLKMLAPGK